MRISRRQDKDGEKMEHKLNPEQQKAVESTEGFVRVIAGAGSGKTRALTHRFAFLVNELGILPQNILCVTFTNKAAGEMRQRIHQLTGDNDTGLVNTFHGFCVSVLQVPVLVQSRKKNGQICFLRPSLKWMSTMIRFLSAFPATSDLVVTVSVSA